MYHISDDIRAHKSAALLAEGLLKCVEKKPFDQITVSDLHEASTVSRATFYRLFDNTLDILQYICDQGVEEVFSHIDIVSVKGPHEFLIGFFAGLMENHRIVRLLAESGHLDMIRAAHVKHYNDIRDSINAEAQDAETVDYILELMTSILPALLRVWIEHGEKETPEELYQQLQRSFRFLGKVFEKKSSR